MRGAGSSRHSRRWRRACQGGRGRAFLHICRGLNDFRSLSAFRCTFFRVRRFVGRRLAITELRFLITYILRVKSSTDLFSCCSTPYACPRASGKEAAASVMIVGGRAENVQKLLREIDFIEKSETTATASGPRRTRGARKGRILPILEGRRRLSLRRRPFRVRRFSI